ncbi:MAG: hypothetical protein ACE5R4_12525 [Armatimonadota bacterium]
MAVECPECKSIVTSRSGYCPACGSSLTPLRRPFNWRPILLGAIFVGGALAVWAGLAALRNKAATFYQENIIEKAVGEEEAEQYRGD